MISTCLSIVQNSFSDYFSAAIISFEHQKVVCGSFQLDGRSTDSTGMHQDIWALLGSELADPETTQVIIAVPMALEVIRVEGIPVLGLAKQSIYMQILAFLQKKSYCTFIQRSLYEVAPDGTREEICLITPSSAKPEELAAKADIVSAMQKQTEDYCRNARRQIFLIPEPLREGVADPPPHKLMLLYPSMAQAYAQFLFGSCPSLAWAAVAAGLVAQNENVYYYLVSRGVVQSSQDIVEFLRSVIRTGYEGFPQVFIPEYPGPEATVMSAEEIYTMKMVKDVTDLTHLEKIPLKYTVAMQKYQTLNEQNAQKLAFLTVCSIWKIRLYCRRLTFEYLFRSHQKSIRTGMLGEEHLIYNPQQSVSPWVLDALQHLS